VVRPLTRICTFKLLTPYRRVSRDFDLTQTLLKSFSNTTTDAHILTPENKGNNLKKFGWTLLPHPPDIPNIPPSEFRLFGVLKDAIRWRSVENDELLKN
jgi:hypothetical protein